MGYLPRLRGVQKLLMWTRLDLPKFGLYGSQLLVIMVSSQHHWVWNG